jgi:lycopene cyclase CruA
MTIHMHRYVEVPSPVPDTRRWLSDHPPLDAVQQGEWWLWQGELWTIQQHHFGDDRMLWQGSCLALPGASFVLSVTLYDATVATHIGLHLAVDFPASPLALFAQRHMQRKVASGIDNVLARLKADAGAIAPAPYAPDHLPLNSDTLAAALRPTHPETVAAFEAMNALPALAAVARLDRHWRATEAGDVPKDIYQHVDVLPPTEADFDLIYAGGGLGLLHAAVMAQRYGRRVLLFDRNEVGCAHREWNISDHELTVLVDIGLFSSAELESVVMRRYHDGIVRFFPHQSAVTPSELHLPDVLSVSLDAAGLLRLARSKLEAAGGIVLDRRTLGQVWVCEPGAVVVQLQDEAGVIECYGARVLVDGMGSTSPLALQRFAGQPFAGVCPTVGTVVSGLEEGPAPDQHHRNVGDILVSVTDSQRGRQLIWEGFGGRNDELTIYLFYYDLVGSDYRSSHYRLSQTSRHSLLDLFEDYFCLLPTYKRPGPHFRHLKPVYGFIPARHTQRRNTHPPLPGVLPVGDSSAQQSPLTFCGFGSHVRNLDRTTSLLETALRHNLLTPNHLAHISAYQANVALNWVFSRFMQPWRSPNNVNQLQNVFARVLNDLGIDVATRFFQDQMRWRDYGRIVNQTLAVYKPIIPTAITVLGPRDATRWAIDWLRFSRAAAAAALGRRVGPVALDSIQSWLWQRKPDWAFLLQSRRAEWRAMGWVSPYASLYSNFN